MKYCGILNLDKPSGLTSRDVVDRVVRIVRPAKAGHAGTLDPLATGVLVVCVGHATRLISLVQEGRKRYLARFLLGQRSDTDDATGTIVEGGDWSSLTENHLTLAVSEFIGRISQVPPQFSAIHVQGRRAYDLARRGQTVELNARLVDVYSLRVTRFQPPEFELEIECGGGTYVRSIGRDLGLRLGCGAIMTALRRLAVGEFEVSDAISLDSLTVDSIGRLLQPARKLVSHLRQRLLTNDELVAVRCGQTISVDKDSIGAPQIDLRTALIGSDGRLIGIGELNSTTQKLHPRIVFPVDDHA